MTKILFISGMYPPVTRGGAEVSAHLLAQGLRDRGFEIHVLAEGNNNDDIVDGIKVFRRELGLTKKPLWEVKHARKVAQLIEEFMSKYGPFDIIHAHDFRAVQALSQINITPVIATVRDYAQICGSPNNLLANGEKCSGCEDWRVAARNLAVKNASWLRKPFRIWQYWFNISFRLESFRAIKNHVYISQAQLADIKERQDLTGIKTAVIYNPVQPEFLSTEIKPGKSGDLLFVGTIESYKGVDVLLKAFKNLAEHNDNVRLRLVGVGAQLEEYKRWVLGSGVDEKIEFLGSVSNSRMAEIYDQAEIVVAPHIWEEPFGRTTVEGMARGKIVVAANVGGPAEIIQDNKTGVLFGKGDADDLARKLAIVLSWNEGQKNTMGQAARDWVKANLQIEQIAEQYDRFYQSI